MNSLNTFIWIFEKLDLKQERNFSINLRRGFIIGISVAPCYGVYNCRYVYRIAEVRVESQQEF
jgi:hypothetical protein